MKQSSSQRQLDGVRVAIISDTGFENAELLEPRHALDEQGATTRVLSVNSGRIQGFRHDEPADQVDVDQVLADANPGEFDAVLLPGGVRNADMLRTSRHAQQFVREIDSHRKLLAVICHGPWLLVSAGLVAGRRLTSWPTLQDDIRNAGGTWVDAPVVVDRNWVSSRKPADIPQFNAMFIEMLATQRRHESVAHGH
jgi:protease I